MKHSAREIADLFDKPGHLIRRAHQIAVAAFEQAAVPFKITGPQHVIMTALYKYPGVDQTALAGMVALDKVTTGDIVIRLEQRGLLRRTRSTRNHRSRAVSLTAAGRRMLLDMQSVVESSKEEILHNLSERERTALMRLLRRLIGADRPPVPGKAPAKNLSKTLSKTPVRLKKPARLNEAWRGLKPRSE